MRSVDELINNTEPGWVLVKEWIDSAKNKVEVLAAEPLNLTYSDFLLFCFNGDLSKFYDGYRWTSWKKEVSKLAGDQVFNFFPPLWTKEGKDINKNSRKAIPIEEQYALNIDMRKQLDRKKNSR